MKRCELNSLIKEITDSIINESMNVYVDGANYDRTDNLNDLANDVAKRSILPTLNSLPQDQLEYFRKNGVPYYEMFVCDGDYYSPDNTNPNLGTINFYISGLTSNPLRIILKSIFQIFRDMGIKWGKIRKEMSKMYKSQVIRIPIIKNDGKYSGPPELNMANSSAYHFFHNILQFEPDDDSASSFTISVKELKDAINSINHDPNWIKKNVKKSSDNHKHKGEWDDEETASHENPHDDIIKNTFGSGGARMISSGIDEERIKRYLIQTSKICEWALKNNFNKITVS